MPLIYENYVTIRYFLNIIVTLLLLFIEKTKQLSCISFVEGFSSQTQLQSLNYIHMSHSGIGVHRVSTRCGANFFVVLRKILNFLWQRVMGQVLHFKARPIIISFPEWIKRRKNRCRVKLLKLLHDDLFRWIINQYLPWFLKVLIVTFTPKQLKWYVFNFVLKIFELKRKNYHPNGDVKLSLNIPL